MTDDSPQQTSSLVGVTRALTVLSHLSAHPSGQPMKNIHTDLGIPFATLHRLLGVLEERGWVVRSATTKRYRLGPAALRLSYVEPGASTIIEPPQELRRASATLGETVFLTQLYDTRVICVSLVEGAHPLRLFVRAGQEMPLHAAASARAILAYQDPSFTEHLLTSSRRDSFTPGTIREVNEVIDHLSTVRQRAFDVCDSELDNDVWAVSAPIFRANGRVDSAVTMAAAGARVVSVDARAKAAAAVLSAARELSTQAGYYGSALAARPLERLAEQMEDGS